MNYLCKRGNTYYFRYKLPSKMGGAEVCHSLRTKLYHEARELIELLQAIPQKVKLLCKVNTVYSIEINDIRTEVSKIIEHYYQGIITRFRSSFLMQANDKYEVNGKEPHLKLSTAFQQFCEYKANSATPLSKAHKQAHQNAIGQFIATQSDKKVNKINKKDIQIYADHLAKTGKTISTVSKMVRYIASLYKWLIDIEEKALKNPCTGIRFSGRYGGRSAFSKQQAIQLIRTCENEPEMWKRWMIKIAFYSGLRIGEICQMQKKDIKKEGDVIYFDISPDESNKKNVKTKAAIRRVPIHQSLIKDGFLDFVSEMKPNDWLWGIEGGIPPVNIANWFNRTLRKKANIPNKTAKGLQLTFHSARHCVVSSLINAGCAEVIKNTIVGHEDKTMAGNYYTEDLTVMNYWINKIEYEM